MNTTEPSKKSSVFSIKLVKIIIAVFISLYLIIWAISSPLSKHFIEPVLLKQGLVLSDETSIYYNPFLSQITISDLTLHTTDNAQKDPVLSLDKLTVRLTLYRFLFDEIVISKFELMGAYLKVIKTPTQLIIAGVDLNKENSEKESEDSEPEAENAEPLPYQFILPKLAINEFNIDIDNNKIAHQYTVKELLISQVTADLKSQKALVDLKSIIDETPVELSAEVDLTNGQGKISSQIALIDYALKKALPYVKELSDLNGKLSFSSEQTLTLGPDETLKLHVNKATIENNNLHIGYQQQFFNLDTFNSVFENINLTLTNNELTDISGTSQIILNNADVYYEKPNQKLAHFKKLTLEDINFLFENEPQVKISNFTVDGIYGSKNENSEYPPIITLKQVNINDIFASAKQLSIDKIILDSLQSDVIINEENGLANLVSLPVKSEKQEETETVSTEDKKQVTNEKENFVISLNEFALINDNRIFMLDNSFEPAKQQQVFIDQLRLGAISNAEDKMELQTPFELKGRNNKYTKFNFTGYTQPFANLPKHHLEGSLKEFSLPSIARYMRKAADVELKKGQLNTDIDVTLTGEKLKGNVIILLRSLETATAENDDAGSLVDKGALPFNVALNMLKDGNGDLELAVPLSGSTSDPNFGVSSILSLITQKAIWMATKDYLMTTFVPYANIVSAAMTVGEFALKLRFEDLIYQTKQIEPNEAQQDYLKAFIALMQDKKDTRVNICGVSTPADIGLIAGTKVTDKKQIHQLKDIAEKREEALKEYIIKHGNIESSRLLLCSPQIDTSKKAKPRIKLSV